MRAEGVHIRNDIWPVANAAKMFAVTTVSKDSLMAFKVTQTIFLHIFIVLSGTLIAL